MATDPAVIAHLNELFRDGEDYLETLPDLADEEEAVRELHPVICEWWGWGAEVKALHEAYRSGIMTDEQRVRYRRLVRRVRDLLPLIDRFGLDRPDIPIEEVLREQATSHP